MSLLKALKVAQTGAKLVDDAVVIGAKSADQVIKDQSMSAIQLQTQRTAREITPPPTFDVLLNYQFDSTVINKMLNMADGNLDVIKDTPYAIGGKKTTMGQVVGTLDGATTKMLQDNDTLYRGVTLPAEVVERMGAGKTFSSKSFLSFSKSQEIAGKFSGKAGQQSERPVIFELSGGRGVVRGLNLEGGKFKQREVLLGRGQEFSIAGKSVDSQGITHVFLQPKTKPSSKAVKTQDGIEAAKERGVDLDKMTPQQQEEFLDSLPREPDISTGTPQTRETALNTAQE